MSKLVTCEELAVDDVNIVEPAMASIALYYLRKAFKYKKMAADILSNTKGIDGSSLLPEVKKALNFEMDSSTRINENTKVIKSFSKKIAWYIRELCLSMLFKKKKIKTDVLFICNVTRQFDSVSPVISELIAKGLSVTVVSKTGIPKSLQTNSDLVNYLNWNDLRSVGYWLKLLFGDLKMKYYWSKEAIHIIKGYEGCVFNKWFKERGVYSLRALLLAKRLIAKVAPSVIVVTDVSDYEVKSFALIGKKRKIPSFCIQYGSLCEHDSEWKFCSNDYIGAFDSETINVLKKFGIAENRILLTGNPRFDSCVQDEGLRKKVRDELGILDDQVFVVYMSVPPSPDGIGQMESYLSQEEHRKMLESVYDMVNKDDHLILGVKPHPEEDREIHNNMAKIYAGNQNNIRLISKHSSYQIINAADIVITVHSTTGLEAIYLDKPLIVVNLTGRDGLEDYSASGAAIIAKKPDELFLAINTYLFNEMLIMGYSWARNDYRLRNPYFSQKKTSAVRCSDIVCELINGKETMICQ